MQHNKKKAHGRVEREIPIEAVWPRERLGLTAQVRGQGCAPDDLNDALAALWTAHRIAVGRERVFPESVSQLTLVGCGWKLWREKHPQ